MFKRMATALQSKRKIMKIEMYWIKIQKNIIRRLYFFLCCSPLKMETFVFDHFRRFSSRSLHWCSCQKRIPMVPAVIYMYYKIISNFVWNKIFSKWHTAHNSDIKYHQYQSRRRRRRINKRNIDLFNGL